MKTVALFVLLAFCTVLAAEGQKPAPLEEPKSESTIPENEDVFRVSLPDFQPRFNPQLSYTSSEAQLSPTKKNKKNLRYTLVGAKSKN